MPVNYKNLIVLAFLLLAMGSCKKLVEISPQIGTVTSSQVFSSNAEANAAMTGIYFSMINNTSFSNWGMTVYGGLSADELITFTQSAGSVLVQFQHNNILAGNVIISGIFWSSAYSDIYAANAILQGLQNYSGVSDSVKNELIGEAEFVRAFCNFYLVNLFGDIPQVTTINWQKTNLLSRTASSQIYQSIVSDLKDAQSRMAADFSVGNGERIIPNKWAATALLARVYLYLKDWNNAAIQSGLIISNTNLFQLTDPSSVFLRNSTEAIWQLSQDNKVNTSFNATPEGFYLIPTKINSNIAPTNYLTNTLMDTFEPGDLRRTSWIDSTTYRNGSREYYFPFKYKIGPSNVTAGGTITEYYMVLRLAEQFLIRAEAEANGAAGGTAAAISDLNTIRQRANLPPYNGPGDQTSVLNAIYHERQIELFAEWGHRWLDLKRLNLATAVLTTNKGYTVNNNMLLFPIPQSELQTDPNLTQNPGYQ